MLCFLLNIEKIDCDFWNGRAIIGKAKKSPPYGKFPWEKYQQILSSDNYLDTFGNSTV